MWKTLLVCLAVLFVIDFAGESAAKPRKENIVAQKHNVGQVWRYKARKGDEDSLLRIALIESMPDGQPVYHISVINVHYGPTNTPNPISHLPVSKETLDNSVIAPINSSEEFPDITEGWEIWSDANGGVFTITMAEIVDISVQSSQNLPE
jgi:hypothetical protein